jgi:glycosyltransferase involved in cell wall biosynthesis
MEECDDGAPRKLLFISPCTPDPQGTGWEQRAFSFLSAYSKFMDVELWFSPTFDNPELGRTANLTRLCVSMTSFRPAAIRDELSASRKRLNQSLATSDVVHVSRLRQVVSAIDHKSMVWDIDELSWSASHQASIDRQQYLSELYSNFRKCRRVFASSHLEREQAHFDEITVIPNVAFDPELRNLASSEKAPALLFVGNLNYSPNMDGLIFFNSSVLPELAGNIPDVLVNVIGRSPITESVWAAVDHLRNTGRFRFVFDAPSVTPYYLQAVASIAPILSGGGTRIKIVESFAHHCPVISTSKGCEGLEVAHRKHLLIEDDPRDFALACVELIQRPELRRQLAETAHRFFEGNHSQRVVDELLFSALQNLA